MFGPDARLLVITLLLIVAPIVMFCTIVARNLHEFPTYNAGYVILVITILFTIYVSSVDSFSPLLTAVTTLMFDLYSEGSDIGNMMNICL